MFDGTQPWYIITYFYNSHATLVKSLQNGRQVYTGSFVASLLQKTDNGKRKQQCVFQWHEQLFMAASIASVKV